MPARARESRNSKPATLPRGAAPQSDLLESQVLAAFQHAASRVPAYQALLAESGVDPDRITSLESFRRCPLLSKTNTFDRFSIDQLSTGGGVADIADVLTSSGRGGRFSFGLSTRSQAAATVGFLDDAFDAAFEVKSRLTLAINCLPMGVVFSSHAMTVATTSVREDMAVGLVKAFGRYYDQILLVGDPLFFKRLTDHALEAGVDWHQHRVHAIVGEEIFGEHFRSYLGARLGSNLETFDGGYIMSSFGVGELGLHLGYETRTTIALRRAAHARPEFARELLGADTPAGDPLPMLFAFNPRRTFIEVCEPDQTGYGLMTTSMLEPERRLPLLRYQTGDIVALVDPDRAAVLAREHGIELPGPIPPALFALRGRDSEALPDGSHVGVHKDAAYSDPAVADRLTGAVRLIVEGRQITMHVQLVPGAEPTDDIAARLRARLGDTGVVVWPYAQFPFGMTLDYERKFACYVPGETAPARAPEPRRG